MRTASPPLFLLAFLGLAMLLYAPAWSSPTTTTAEGADGDAAIIIWFLRWIPFAVDQGRPLLFSNHLNFPGGVNLMWNASLPLFGFVLSPLTSRWGPVLTFNVVLVLANGLSAWAAYLAIRRYVARHLAAAVGGLVFGFSPAILGQSGHPHIYNEAATLAEAIKSVLGVVYSYHTELVLVSVGSTDQAPEIRPAS